MPIYQIFFYLTILLLPTQLGLHFWPEWALVLGRRIDYLAPTIYLTDITVLLTLVTYILKKHTYSNVSHFIRRHGILIANTLLYITLNIFFSANPLIPVMKWGKVFEYILFFYYIYKTRPSFKITIYCLMIAVLYSSVIAHMQFFLQHSIGGIFWFLGERTFTLNTPGIAKLNWCWFSGVACTEVLRPYATFSHPNVLGGFLTTIVPLLLWQLQKEKAVIIRLFLLISITLGVSTLLITCSRSAWIIGAAVLFGTVWLISIKKPWVVRTIWIITTCGILFFLFPYIQTLTKGNESVFIRVDLMKASIELFAKHPITGIGLGMFLPSLPQVLSVRDLYFLQPVHNIYLLLLTETGSIGIILFSVELYFYINAVKKKKNLAIILLPCIALALLGFVDHYPFSVQQGQLLTTTLLALPFLNMDS